MYKKNRVNTYDQKAKELADSKKVQESFSTEQKPKGRFTNRKKNRK